MYLLYIDDSGIATGNTCKYSILAGFSTHETQNFWIQKAIDKIMMEHTNRTDLELHASPIRTGKGIWRTFSKEEREALLIDVYNYIKDNYPSQFILFGAVINNKKEDVVENLFMQITSRFDKYLQRKFMRHNEQARGLAIFDKSKTELQYQNWSKIYQNIGNKWGDCLHNFAEVPLFLDSEMSRSIQVADLIAYALFRNFEYNDDKYYSIIKDCFDSDKTAQHGLFMDL